MSAFWNFYVMGLVALGLGFAVFLLLWGSTRRMHADEEGTTGHVWDGDLKENIKPVPRWWFVWSAAWIIAAIGYLVLYRGFGNFEGVRGTDQQKRFDAQAATLAQQFDAASSAYADAPVDQLAAQPEAVALGARAYAQHCAVCHGADARGARGFPDLTDAHWIWGDAPDQLLTTVLDGRQAAMPPFGEVLGEAGVTATAVYVQGLAGGRTDPMLARAGEAHYKAICIACHGADGRGNPALGAPDLTAGTWTYGGDYATIAETIRHGRNGRMPPQRDVAGATGSRLAVAWVLAQKGSGDPHAAAEH